MEAFEYAEGRLACESLDLAAIARTVATPFYVYSARAMRDRYQRVARAFSQPLPSSQSSSQSSPQGSPQSSPQGSLANPWVPEVCFSVKSCPNLAILRLLAEEGAGFDVVSGGELRRVLAVGADPAKVVFAGVGKTDDEIAAALDAGVRFLNIESVTELDVVDRIAAGKELTAHVLLRVNPDVDAKTHRHISTGRQLDKFGVGVDDALRLIRQRLRYEHTQIHGFHAHIGSQINSLSPFSEVFDRLEPLFKSARAEGIDASVLDIGGGFPIAYQGEERDIAEVADAVLPRAAALGVRLIVEPGRFIAGPAGALITEVTFVKRRGDRRFVIVDAGMTELIRPVLYDAHHEITPVVQPMPDALAFRCDVVGPICETGDYLALDREMPALARGDLLAIMNTGAYGSSMGSNYNSRLRPPEVLVDGDRFTVIRRRETFEDLIRLEQRGLSGADVETERVRVPNRMES